MPRITCKTPASGKPLSLSRVDIPTTFTNLADAPDFSVPDPSGSFTERDPANTTRAIRPGEIFLLAPLAVYNKTATARWVEVQLVTEAGTTILSPGRVTVPAFDTVYIPVQGRSLTKRLVGSSNGDRLQIRAEAAAALDVWGSAEERLSAEHIGVV
jgi:hypothetical protein